MNRIIFASLLVLISQTVFSQTAKLGQVSKSEIALTDVDYEPGAPAVVLVSQGDSRFFSDIVETSYFFRIKILSDAGKRYADATIRYYLGEKRVEEVSGIKAQTINFSEGQAETIKVDDSNIFNVEVGDGYNEIRISFPNVQVGSILEYTYKKTDKNLTFIDGWTFQNNVPTIFSKYQITMSPYFVYNTIGQGYNFANNSEKTDSNGTYSWSLRNLYSLKEEPFMKNYRDYTERLEFQLSKYQSGSSSSGVEWKNVMGSWASLGDEMIELYADKGYYRSNPIERELVAADLSGSSQTETAQKAYYYLRDNFVIEGDDWIYPKQSINQLLKSRTGSPAEMMLTLMGLLKSAGIKCEPVLIGSKGYGRSELVQTPFLTQFDEILLLAEVDGSLQYLDLNDKMAPFGYIDLDKQVAGGLQLLKGKSTLIAIDIRHNSNTVHYSEVKLNERGELHMASNYRNYFYRGLEFAHLVEEKRLKNEPLEKLFKAENDVVYSNFFIDDALEEKNMYTLNYEMTFPESGADMISFNPLQFSSFSENPFSSEFRIFPVDFEYAFNETYNTNVLIPEGYEVDDYPMEESFTIEGGYLNFIYKPILVDGMLKITARLEVKKPLIPAAQYANLKFFMESVASKLSEPVILKKTTAP
jgi:hypothetical protein